MIITLFWIWILFDLEFASHNAWKTVGKLLLILGKGQGLACRHPLSITVNIWTSRWALQTCYTSIRLIGCCKYSLKTWRNAIMLQQGCWRINSCSAVCVCVCVRAQRSCWNDKLEILQSPDAQLWDMSIMHSHPFQQTAHRVSKCAQ